MFLDKLLDDNDPNLQEGKDRYPDLIAASEAIDEPNISAVLTPKGTHVWTNLSECSEDDVLDLGTALVIFFVDHIAKHSAVGRADAALWLMDAISACG